MAASSSVSVAQVRCTLLEQTDQTLALVCSFLDVKSLHSFYQSCSAAVARSHIFRHADAIGMDVMCGLRFIGPNFCFRRSELLSAALQSKLMRHVRLLTLTDAPVDQGAPSFEAVTQLLRLLSTPAALVVQLRGLALRMHMALSPTSGYLEPDASSQEESHEKEKNSFNLSQLPCAYSLKALLLQASMSSLTQILRFPLPPSLHLLQLESTSCERDLDGTVRALPSNLPEQIALLPHLRFLWLWWMSEKILGDSEPGSGSGERSMRGLQLEDLSTLERTISAAPQLEAVHLLGLLDLRCVVTPLHALCNLQSGAAPTVPCLHKVTQMVTTDYGLFDAAKDSTTCEGADALAVCFPRLCNLIVLSTSSKTQNVGICRWPESLATSLIFLRMELMSGGAVERIQMLINSLAAIRLTALRQLELINSRIYGISPNIRLGPLLSSLPELTALTLSFIGLHNLQDFEFAPKLTTLGGLIWPYQSDRTPLADEADKVISPFFPSLTTLHVQHARCVL